MIREVQQESVAAGALEYDACLCSTACSPTFIAVKKLPDGRIPCTSEPGVIFRPFRVGGTPKSR